MISHPAKFSAPIIDEIGLLLKTYLPNGGKICDLFGGVGGVHQLRKYGDYWTVGVEIEEEWASAHPSNVCGDSLLLDRMFHGRPFDAICTSPTYANRMADHHNARDDSKRNTYRHTLGRPLNPNNSGKLQWSEDYRGFHRRIWRQCRNVLRPGGLLILNVSDHIRKGQVQPVTDWHLACLRHLGFVDLELEHRIETKRQKFGANADARVGYESVIPLRLEV